MDYHEGLDLTSAEVSSQLYDLALSARVRIYDLDSRWYEVRNIIIDIVTRTLSLGVFTFVAVGTLYIVISRNWRDWTAAIILLSILPDCISTFTAWLAALSKIAQDYAMLGLAADDIGSQVDIIVNCVDNFDLCFDSASVHSPLYAEHGCVGTALIATDAIMHAAVLCVCIAVYLFMKRPLSLLPKFMGALVFLPFLAACASAITHVKRVCWPEFAVLPGGLTIMEEWAVYDPHDLDDTTARLAMVARVMSLLLVASYAWEARSMYAEQFRDPSVRSRWIYWLGITFIVPVCVNEGWRRLCEAYEDEPSEWPVLQRAFFSLGNAIIVPLMDMYPGLALLVQKLKGNIIGDEGTATTEKLDIAEAVPSPTAPTADLGTSSEKALPTP